MYLEQCVLLFAVTQCVLDVIKAQNITNVTNKTVAEVPGPHDITDVLSQPPIPQNLTDKTVAEAFTKNHIVPDIIPVAPTTRSNVTFPNGVKASLGNKLTPTQVKNISNVTWYADSSQYYTLIAVDPDLPSRQFPAYRSTLHWRVVNIRGANITSGTTNAEYISAGPPAGTGLHRFVFLVYQQPGNIIFNETKLYSNSSDGRYGFSVADFALKYNLSDPVAGNFFHTSYDNYVPILYKQLGYSKGKAVAPENLIIPALVTVIFRHVMF